MTDWAHPSLVRRGGAVLLLIAALLAPLVLTDFQLLQTSLALATATAVLSLTMLMGFCGQVSLGQGGFYALGAYTVAVLVARWGIPYPAAVLAAACTGFLVGALVGMPSVRLKGPYLAMATLTLAVATPQLLKHFEPWTGGVQGVLLPRPVPPAGLALSPDQWIYVLTLSLVALLFVSARTVLSGQIGITLRAIRDNEAVAEVLGVPVYAYKLVTFAVAGMYASVAGGLAATAVQFVSPDNFGVFLSINLFVGAIVGGVISLFGALLGGFVIHFLPSLWGGIWPTATWLLYGICLILGVALVHGKKRTPAREPGRLGQGDERRR